MFWSFISWLLSSLTSLIWCFISSETQGTILGARESLNGRKKWREEKSVLTFLCPWVPEDGCFSTLGDNRTTPPSLPPVYWAALSPQSSPFTAWIMADEELLKIVVELRKFRKKLRQIEKLEELERDLTDEEFFKVNYCR